MNPKEFILEVFRETDFINESTNWNAIKDEPTAVQLRQSLAAINKACSAFLNGQEVEPHVDDFLRRKLEQDVYEELEIWGKFSPPPQFIDHGESKSGANTDAANAVGDNNKTDL